MLVLYAFTFWTIVLISGCFSLSTFKKCVLEGNATSLVTSTSIISLVEKPFLKRICLINPVPLSSLYGLYLNDLKSSLNVTIILLHWLSSKRHSDTGTITWLFCSYVPVMIFPFLSSPTTACTLLR